MSIANNIIAFRKKLPETVTLIAVSKTKPNEAILEAYNAGQRDFGENRVQELIPKHDALPKDIRWHLIGHLQTNKVKFVAGFVHMIHSIDSEKLLEEVSKQALKHNRVITVLLQIFIAQEETKFGFSFEEAADILSKCSAGNFPGVSITGFMGMATNTDSKEQVQKEFRGLSNFFRQQRMNHPNLVTLSMGMSSDWDTAIAEGSTMIRVGSSLFGTR